jgi:hypothetical protein
MDKGLAATFAKQMRLALEAFDGHCRRPLWPEDMIADAATDVMRVDMVEERGAFGAPDASSGNARVLSCRFQVRFPQGGQLDSGN